VKSDLVKFKNVISIAIDVGVVLQGAGWQTRGLVVTQLATDCLVRYLPVLEFWRKRNVDGAYLFGVIYRTSKSIVRAH